MSRHVAIARRISSVARKLSPVCCHACWRVDPHRPIAAFERRLVSARGEIYMAAWSIAVVSGISGVGDWRKCLNAGVASLMGVDGEAVVAQAAK